MPEQQVRRDRGRYRSRSHSRRSRDRREPERRRSRDRREPERRRSLDRRESERRRSRDRRRKSRSRSPQAATPQQNAAKVSAVVGASTAALSDREKLDVSFGRSLLPGSSAAINLQKVTKFLADMVPPQQQRQDLLLGYILNAITREQSSQGCSDLTDLTYEDFVATRLLQGSAEGQDLLKAIRQMQGQMSQLQAK
eukprot:TRINITY_DN4172_c4_g1_i1.p1 TRINITY_DN4172_c4_g1~~TRINITY_DN4172_c4_g1_i1.p1  ORF type:complete len:221 (+),score=23.72 TRINITY_DN4172_c4_g1_i1:76-663(+)